MYRTHTNRNYSLFVNRKELALQPSEVLALWWKRLPHRLSQSKKTLLCWCQKREGRGVVDSVLLEMIWKNEKSCYGVRKYFRFWALTHFKRTKVSSAATKRTVYKVQVMTKPPKFVAFWAWWLKGMTIVTLRSTMPILMLAASLTMKQPKTIGTATGTYRMSW